MPILNWLTRDQDIGAAKDVPYRLLEETAELSAGDPNTGNMLIQGDNLEALKALLPYRFPRGRLGAAQVPGIALITACLPRRKSEQDQLLGRFFLTECRLTKHQSHACILLVSDL